MVAETGLKCRMMANPLLVQVSIMYKVPSPVDSPAVFVSLRAACANHKCLHHRAVIDLSKAVIAEAKVAAVNLGTNFRHETVTDSTGEYTLANLPPGTHRIEVEKSGFKKLIRPDVTLHVQDAQGQFSVNGQRTDANYFTVDGASTNFGVTG